MLELKQMMEEMLANLPADPKTPSERFMVSSAHVSIAHSHTNAGRLESAVQEHTVAANLGNAEGMHNLGICLLEGQGTTKNIEIGKYWILKASDQPIDDSKDLFQGANPIMAFKGQAAAWNAIGNFHVSGLYGFRKDETAAKEDEEFFLLNTLRAPRQDRMQGGHEGWRRGHRRRLPMRTRKT